MKVKVRDLTEQQFNKICIQYKRCEGCPLEYANSTSTYHCLIPYREQLDYEVDIPDDLLGIKEEKWPIHSKDEALQMIIDLADDYDNANSVEGLKSLIDELVEIAKAGVTK